ncbi:Pup--protein ligase [Corynebacterium aquatimens]|nr:Pup--protein ligase [Corynebacterium aquatimens]
MGVETEFGATAVRDGSAVLSPDEVSRYLFKPVIAAHKTSNIFTNSGSRLYLDVGSHPEYATAECDTVTQLLNHDKAGELIFEDLAAEAEQTLANEGIGGQIYLFKNNVDSKFNSYGCHENYLITRELLLKHFAKGFIPFLVTRQMLCGAGMIKDGTFHISQRAEQVWEAVSSSTTRTRPMINTRDEPHGDSKRFRRMHVIVGDSNMAEPTFALKIGSTQLVLEMLEAKFTELDARSLELADAITAIKDVSLDTTGQARVELKAGGEMTALEIQRIYYEAAKSWLDNRPDEGTPNHELSHVLDLWGRVLEAVDKQDFSLVDREIDWVIKYNLFQRYRERLGCEWSHPKLAQIDLTYHDIRRNRGLFYMLQAKGLVERWTTDSAIEAAKEFPPETTRAVLRSKFLSRARELHARTNVDWVHLKVDRPEPQTVELLDPFETVDPRVDTLIEYMETHHG